MKRRFIPLVLAAALAFSVLPSTVARAESSDETSEKILVGMMVVVAGLLIVLGVRSDYDWRYGDEDGDELLRYASVDDPTVSLQAEGLAIRW